MSDYIPDSAAAPTDQMIDPLDDIAAFMGEVMDWQPDLPDWVPGEAVPHFDAPEALHREPVTNEILMHQATTAQKHGPALSSQGPPRSATESTSSLLQHVTVHPSQASAARHRECPYEGCPYTGKDTNRHVRTVHEKARPFMCPAAGCFKKRIGTAFPRSYQLTNHLKASHLHSDNLSCPDPRCSPRRWNLESLAIHVTVAHNLYEKQSSFSAIAGAILGQQQCLVCRQCLPLRQFVRHVLSHDHEEVHAVAEDLRQKNYVLELRKVADTSPGSSKSDHAVTAPHVTITHIKVMCPICQATCHDHRAFEAHVLVHHLILPEQRAWLANWHPRCYWTVLIYHAEKLVSVDLMGPYRMQILRLYPNFIEHCLVWDDFS